MRQYTSPEQDDGETVQGSLSRSSDEYSLACVAYECLTGQQALARWVDSAFIPIHLLGERHSVQAALERVPARLGRVFARGFAIEPSQRFPSCADLVEALAAELPDDVPQEKPADAGIPRTPPPPESEPEVEEGPIGDRPVIREHTQALVREPTQRLHTTPDPLLGSVLAGHQIEAELGRGGMSTVYQARHLRIDKTRALKVLAHHLAEDEDYRERFEREWRQASAVEHPSIAEIIDAGEDEGRLYIVMRYVGELDLRELLEREGPLASERALALLEPIASALDAVSSAGLVHRDVKPANIILDPRERAFLTDFGVAKQTSSPGLTERGVFVGTLDYAAPEQFDGGTLDGRTDVYALTGVLYWCLTGALPFERPTDAQLMNAHMREPPPRVTAERPELPRAIDEVIARGMAKSKERRYRTCSELIAAARGALAVSLPEKTPLPPERGPGPLATVEARVSAFLGVSGRRQLLRAAGGTAVLLMLVIAVVAVWLADGDRGEQSVDTPPPIEEPVAEEASPAETPGEAAGSPEEELLASVPSHIRKRCATSPATETTGASIASVKCRPGQSGVTVWYELFPSTPSMNTYYNGRRRQFDIAQGSRTGLGCDNRERDWLYETESGEVSGRAFCTASDNGAVLTWTDSRLTIVSEALHPDGDYEKLVSFWTKAGPE